MHDDYAKRIEWQQNKERAARLQRIITAEYREIAAILGDAVPDHIKEHLTPKKSRREGSGRT